nr:glutathione S-transferase T3-like [Tanacetum cinerariifolium]
MLQTPNPSWHFGHISLGERQQIKAPFDLHVISCLVWDGSGFEGEIRRRGERGGHAEGNNPFYEVDQDDDDEEVAVKRVTIRWNRDEEILLAETWIEHYHNANIRKDQQEDIFWNLIMEDYNSRTKFASRTKNTMSEKWTRMHGDCQMFNAIYKHLTRKSEKSDADLVENAKASYMERYGNKIFIYDHAWNVLKNYPKWNAGEPIDEDN